MLNACTNISISSKRKYTRNTYEMFAVRLSSINVFTNHVLRARRESADNVENNQNKFVSVSDNRKSIRRMSPVSLAVNTYGKCMSVYNIPFYESCNRRSARTRFRTDATTKNVTAKCPWQSVFQRYSCRLLIITIRRNRRRRTPRRGTDEPPTLL